MVIDHSTLMDKDFVEQSPNKQLMSLLEEAGASKLQRYLLLKYNKESEESYPMEVMDSMDAVSS